MMAPDTLPLLLEHLRAGRPVTVRARGASMRPSLRDGDVITLTPRVHPRRGDVACAVRAGSLRLHRVVATEGERVLLRGDALLTDDGWFEPTEVYGVVRDIRRGGKPVAALFFRGALPAVLGHFLYTLRRAVALLRLRRTSDHVRP